MSLAAALLVVAVLVCLVAAALLLRGAAPAGTLLALGGASVRSRRGPKRPDPAASPHLVVDTLNLTHWLRSAPVRFRASRKQSHGRGAAEAGPPEPLSPAAIVAAIDRTAPALRARHPGRVVYVLKDRESQYNVPAVRDLYHAAAKRNGVYLAVAERLPDPPAGAPANGHSARGRDDFYMAVLAGRYKCAVLTEDRMRDFDRFRAAVQPFHVFEYAYWSDVAGRDHIRPDARKYAALKKPRRLGYAAYLAPLP